jgi:nitrate reductase NapE component
MFCIFAVAMVGGLGDPKDEAPTRQEKKMITAQAESKESLDTGSWGTSCLSPGFVSMFCIFAVAMVGGLGDPKDEAPTRQEKKMITALAESKESLDTGSWGTSCLSPGFVLRFMGYVLSVTGFT